MGWGNVRCRKKGKTPLRQVDRVLSLIGELRGLAGGEGRGRPGSSYKTCSAARFCQPFFSSWIYSTVAIELETAISHISQGMQGQYSRVYPPRQRE
jgi:hypothetical protein